MSEHEQPSRIRLGRRDPDRDDGIHVPPAAARAGAARPSLGASDRLGRQRIDVVRGILSSLRTKLPPLRDAFAEGGGADARERLHLARRAALQVEDVERILAEARRYVRVAPELQAEYDEVAAAAAPLIDEVMAYRAATREPAEADVSAETVQRRSFGAADAAIDPLAVAARGVAGPGGPLPFLDTIQRSFGAHGVMHVQAHVGGAAARASAALGAEAYATGDHVAFAAPPSLHTAAHEAAHVIQQRAGVQLKGGLGEAGDAYEQHADAVADAVVRGESAEALLGAVREGGGGAAVQRQATKELDPNDLTPASATRALLEANDPSSLLAAIETQRPSMLPAILSAVVTDRSSRAVERVAVAAAISERIEAIFSAEFGTGVISDQMFFEALRLPGTGGAFVQKLFTRMVRERDEKWPALKVDGKAGWLEKSGDDRGLAWAFGTFHREPEDLVAEMSRLYKDKSRFYDEILANLPDWMRSDWMAARRFVHKVVKATGAHTTNIRVDVAAIIHSLVAEGLGMEARHESDDKRYGARERMDWFLPLLAEVIARKDVIKHFLRPPSKRASERSAGVDDAATRLETLRHYLRDLLRKAHRASTKMEVRELLNQAVADLLRGSIEAEAPTIANQAGRFLGEYVNAEKDVGREVGMKEILVEMASFFSNFAGPVEHVVEGVAQGARDDARDDRDALIDASVDDLLGRIYEEYEEAPSDDPNDHEYETWAQGRDDWTQEVHQGYDRARVERK